MLYFQPHPTLLRLPPSLPFLRPPSLLPPPSFTFHPSLFLPSTREEVTEIMKDMQDGAFLVRDAARVAGHYTLTLRSAAVPFICTCTLYMLALPYLAYITVDSNPADWAALAAQLAEHWTSNPVVTGSNPIRGSLVFFSLSAFGLCLRIG